MFVFRKRVNDGKNYFQRLKFIKNMNKYEIYKAKIFLPEYDFIRKIAQKA